MRVRLSRYSWIPIIALCGAAACRQAPDSDFEAVLPDASFVVSERPASAALQLASKVTLIPIQSVPKAIEHVSRVKEDNQSTDYLVSDLRLGVAIGRYSRDGRLHRLYAVRDITGAAPDEKILDFDLTPDGCLLILTTRRLAHVDSEGKTVRARAIDYSGWNVVAAGLDAVVFGSRPSPDGNRVLYFYNNTFRLLHSAERYDKRLKGFTYLAGPHLAWANEHLWLGRPYEPEIVAYGTDASGEWRWRYGATSPIAASWPSRLTPAQESEVVKTIDRPRMLVPIGSRVLMWRSNPSELWLLDEQRKQALRYPNVDPRSLSDSIGVTMDRLVGSTDTAVIGSLLALRAKDKLAAAAASTGTTPLVRLNDNDLVVIVVELSSGG